MTHIYCRGAWVELLETDGWFQCSGCGRNICRTDATFEVDTAGVSSPHGRQADLSENDWWGEEDASAGGAVQA